MPEGISEKGPDAPQSPLERIKTTTTAMSHQSNEWLITFQSQQGEPSPLFDLHEIVTVER